MLVSNIKVCLIFIIVSISVIEFCRVLPETNKTTHMKLLLYQLKQVFQFLNE